MSQTYEFYEQRARDAADEAAEATLENVRERNLRAEQKWRGLADQARRVALNREKQNREKAEQALEAEQAEQALEAEQNAGQS